MAVQLRRRPTRPALALLALVSDLLLWGGNTQIRLGGEVPVWVVVVFASIAYACLAVSKRPLLGYAAMWPMAFVGLLIPFECVFGFMAALFTMARRAPAPTAIMALLGAALPITGNTVNAASYTEDPSTGLVLMIGGMWALLFVATWGAGRALCRVESRLRLERRRAQSSRDEALAAERLRISRELHDIVAHSLTAIVMQAAGARALRAKQRPDGEGEEPLDAVLAAIQTTGAQSMRELHRLLGLLRQDGAEEAREPGGPHCLADIAELIEAARLSGMRVGTSIVGEPVRVDPSIAHTAYRVVQEGLANAMKYAGAGARVECRQRWDADGLTLTVRNWSGEAGPAAVSGGFGLVGLRERLAVSGGSLRAGPEADGFLLEARLPTTQER